jgi:hypothetical protein
MSNDQSSENGAEAEAVDEVQDIDLDQADAAQVTGGLAGPIDHN